MRSYKTDAVIIRRTNFGEADRIVTVFSKDFGKIKIMAKGVRKITSRRSPSIELFTLAKLVIYKGRGMDILTEVQTIQSFEHIRGDLHSVALAYHVCELIDGLCPEGQQSDRIFSLLIKTLRDLDGGIIHAFETTLLTELGFLGSDTNVTEANMGDYIEEILERRLKSKKLLMKL